MYKLEFTCLYASKQRPKSLLYQVFRASKNNHKKGVDIFKLRVHNNTCKLIQGFDKIQQK